MSIIHKLKLILMKSARNYKISMTRILAGVSLAFFASGIATAANESSSPHADAIESILQQKAINGKVLDAAGEPFPLRFFCMENRSGRIYERSIRKRT